MDKYLITREEIAAFPGLSKTHFLNPNAKRVNKSLGDLTGLTGIGFHLIELAPGAESTEFHRHYHEDECVYILEGRAEARVGERRLEVGAGDFLGYRAGGEAHTLRNTGDTVLRCLVAGQRLAHDVADYPDQHKRIYRNAGMPANVVNLDDVAEAQVGRKA